MLFESVGNLSSEKNSEKYMENPMYNCYVDAVKEIKKFHHFDCLKVMEYLYYLVCFNFLQCITALSFIMGYNCNYDV